MVPQYEHICHRKKVLAGKDRRMKMTIIGGTYQRTKIKILVDPYHRKKVNVSSRHLPEDEDKFIVGTYWRTDIMIIVGI